MSSQGHVELKKADSPSNTTSGNGLETDTQARHSAIPRSSASLLNHLPNWISSNLRSPRSRKLLFRCWVASWASFVLIIPHGSSVALGATGFFALLTSAFLPPDLPLQLFLLIITTLLLGILLGWGLGAAAMRTALAARDMALVKSQLQQVQASARASGINPQLALTSAIFSGTFLDTWSSVVFGCFLAFGTFIFGLMRAYAPKLLMMSIFGTIALDIFCSIGTLFPVARYNLLNSLLISVSSYTAIALVATLVIFPETMNHSVMTSISGLSEGIHVLMKLQDDVLDTNPEDLVRTSPLMNEIATKRAGVIQSLQQLMATSGLLNLEFSWGRWNGDDVRALEEPLLAVVSRVSSILSFSRLVGQNPAGDVDTEPTRKGKEDQSSEASSSSGNLTASEASSSSGNLTASDPITTNDSYLLRQIHMRNHRIENERNLRIHDLLPVIKECTADLRRSLADGVLCAKAAIDLVNQARWRIDAENEEKVSLELRDAITRLSETLSEFKSTKRLAVTEPYLELIKAAKTPDQQDLLPLRSLYLAYVFAANLMAVSSVTLTFMELVADTMGKRRKNRLWAPKGLRAIGKIITARGDKRDAALGDAAEPKREDIEIELEPHRRDPDSRPPKNVIQRIMHSIHLVWRWMKTPEGLFTLKYVIVSVALWLPAVIKHSARFYYVQRGFWALIMAQTTINIYAADQIFNLITRILGTFIGLIAGLVAWYMGNGSSQGNPYGSAAAVGALLVPVVFVRMFAPLHYSAGIVLGCATFALVVGYSWVDGHIAQYSSPGLGWPVAWKRFVLVIIGSAASFIIMMLPPRSGRKAVRLRNASTIIGLCNVYSFLTAAWISTELHEKTHPDAQAAWIPQFRHKLVTLVGQLQAVKELTELAKWEGNVRGHWPYNEYERLGNVQMEMLSSLAQLGGALSHLEDTWRLAFLHNTKALNPNFIGDVVSMFATVSQSLRTGEPMHQVLPYPLLERLFYHHGRSHNVSLPHHHRHNILDIEQIQSLEYVYYATGQVAIYQLLQSLDELHEITKRLCGDVPLKGFDRWRDEYARMHTKV